MIRIQDISEISTLQNRFNLGKLPVEPIFLSACNYDSEFLQLWLPSPYFQSIWKSLAP